MCHVHLKLSRIDYGFFMVFDYVFLLCFLLRNRILARLIYMYYTECSTALVTCILRFSCTGALVVLCDREQIFKQITMS